MPRDLPRDLPRERQAERQRARPMENQRGTDVGIPGVPPKPSPATPPAAGSRVTSIVVARDKESVIHGSSPASESGGLPPSDASPKTSPIAVPQRPASSAFTHSGEAPRIVQLAPAARMAQVVKPAVPPLAEPAPVAAGEVANESISEAALSDVPLPAPAPPILPTMRPEEAITSKTEFRVNWAPDSRILTSFQQVQVEREVVRAARAEFQKQAKPSARTGAPAAAEIRVEHLTVNLEPRATPPAPRPVPARLPTPASREGAFASHFLSRTISGF